MAIDQQTVYFLRFVQRDYEHLRVLAGVSPESIDLSAIHGAIDTAVDVRLSFAKDLLVYAASLDESTSDICARNKVSRAYYAVHHCLRSLMLFQRHGDIDGHKELIFDAVRQIQGVGFLRSRLPASDQLRSELNELLEHRHAADYEPLGVSAPDNAERDFPAIAGTAMTLAENLMAAISDYIVKKRAGELQ